MIHFSSSVRNKRKQNFHFCIQTHTHACMHQSFTFIVIQIAYIVCTKICSENRLHVVRLEMFTFWCTSFRSVLFYSISLIRVQYLICDCNSTLQRQVVDSRKCNTQSKQTEGRMKIVPMMIKWEWSVYRRDVIVSRNAGSPNVYARMYESVSVRVPGTLFKHYAKYRMFV